MKEQAAYIYGTAAHVWPVKESQPDLSAQIQAAWGKRFRRVNHFIELAMVGAKSCLAQLQEPLASDCDVYVATEQGNVASVASIIEALFKHQESPMPLEFLNVPNNMAGFYIAQGLGLHSSNLTIAHRAFPFETALDIAMFNIATSYKTNARALVGGVEECAYPLAQHRQRMGIPADTLLAEGSSWLYMGNESQYALATCEWVKFFPDYNALQTYLQNNHLPPSTYLAGGYGVDKLALDNLANKLGIDNRYDCQANAPYHDTYCAYVIASFISAHQGQNLLFINRDKHDRYVAVRISILDRESIGE
jgi:hypothetical protein